MKEFKESSKKEGSEKEKDRLAQVKAKRSEMAHLSEFKAEVDHREAFRRYFLKNKKKFNLKNSMEDVLWRHLKATGCDSAEKFQEGLAHFGYKE